MTRVPLENSLQALPSSITTCLGIKSPLSKTGLWLYRTHIPMATNIQGISLQSLSLRKFLTRLLKHLEVQIITRLPKIKEEEHLALAPSAPIHSIPKRTRLSLTLKTRKNTIFRTKTEFSTMAKTRKERVHSPSIRSQTRALTRLPRYTVDNEHNLRLDKEEEYWCLDLREDLHNTWA